MGFVVKPAVHAGHGAKLAEIARAVGWPKHVCDVGVYCADACETVPFVQDLQCRVQMFEPQPEGFADLQDRFGGLANVEMHNVAIVDTPGRVKLRRNGAIGDAYLDGVVSPRCKDPRGHAGYADFIEVEGKLFSDYDDGTIDLIQIDVEGADWFILKHMVSRPKIIVVEWAIEKWVNQHQEAISKWADDNGYDGRPFPHNDRIFIKR